MKKMTGSRVFVFLMVATALLSVCHGGVLRKKFYRKTCPSAETIVQDITWKRVANNPELVAKFLRMHFHDCFVRGCDASILINSTASNTAEKDSPANLSLAGFEVLEEIKSALENACPNTVSCADILTLATRDAVSFQFKKPLWEVLTGRRDGRVSLASDIPANLPSPFSNFTTLKSGFSNKGLTVHDLVVLSGGHTIGLAHCNTFSPRLYNFTGKGDQDPSLDPSYATFLKGICSPTDSTTTVEMDQGSGTNFDSGYFTGLTKNKGLFISDAALLTNKGARNIVNQLTIQADFFTEFGQSMKRMGAIDVLTGTAGEIRKVCGKIN
ncbi:hypothetical protein SAY87_006621 [Trapa incisa]|uniref:Peroxidase n=1 Tax=Trapa incisa TaxID=236973 RepID=A0AAN7K1E2_9MYRT|nr:hypothetical protein SAY87_006621 [Trapa incisa]